MHPARVLDDLLIDRSFKDLPQQCHMYLTYQTKLMYPPLMRSEMPVQYRKISKVDIGLDANLKEPGCLSR